MHPHLTHMIAQERRAELQHAAQRLRTVATAQQSPHDGRVTLRFGSAADDGTLARLSTLDSSKPPAHPVLLAEVNGQLRAALGLSDGMAVADPFHPTADLIDLLRARARQLGDSRQITRSGRLPSWSRLRALAWH